MKPEARGIAVAAFDWSTIFDNFGVKRVSATDKGKSAYVLNEDQRAALSAAGRDPKDRATFAIEILFDPAVKTLPSSYYASLRKGAGRTPEARIGRGLINWAREGDRIVVGNRGDRVMAAKVDAAPREASELGQQLARKGDRAKIIKKAKKAGGKPARKDRIVSDFVRDPYVVAAALLRAGGVCEMPACTSKLFKRDDGSKFLEVHHVHPLGEGGDDSLENAAALCPSCHRELHYGRKRTAKRVTLAAAIAAKPV